MGLLSLVPSFIWRWLALGGLVVAVWGYGWVKGSEHEERLLDAFKANVEAQAQAEKVKNLQTIAAQQQITKGIEADYEKKIVAVASAYSNWVPVRADSSKLPTISCPSASPNEKSSDLVSLADYRELASLAAQTTQQLISLQSWVAGQVKISP